MLNVLEQLNAEQIVHVPTCGRNTLDVVYAHNVCTGTYANTSFERIYEISNHKPLAMENTLDLSMRKPIDECY